MLGVCVGGMGKVGHWRTEIKRSFLRSLGLEMVWVGSLTISPGEQEESESIYSITCLFSFLPYSERLPP